MNRASGISGKLPFSRYFLQLRATAPKRHMQQRAAINAPFTAKPIGAFVREAAPKRLGITPVIKPRANKAPNRMDNRSSPERVIASFCKARSMSASGGFLPVRFSAYSQQSGYGRNRLVTPGTLARSHYGAPDNEAMMYDEQSGHDALFEGIEIDAVNNTVSISLLAYPSEGSAQRIPVAIEFTGVESVTMQADMVQLAGNRFAGTVNQWRIAQGPGTSYFYLVEGYLAIASKLAPNFVQV